jgi:hypothetical protein
MLLSLSHKFIFVANLKSASSSIERALTGHAEFRATQTRFGKHDPLSTISKKFAWVRKYVPFEEFFVFGVIREPVDYILSLYNFHHKEVFDGKLHSSKGLSFDKFLTEWCTRSWQARPQHLRFVDRHHRLKTSYLIDFARLDDEFPQICNRLGVRGELHKVNISPQILSRDDLTPDQIGRIVQQYADDYTLLKNRPQKL